MNRPSRTRRRRFVTAAAAATALRCFLVLVTASCGPPSHGSGRAADREQALAFAPCMRNNSVPGFPEPDPSGRLRGVGHEQQDNPTCRAAFEACRQKLPGGGGHQ